ncbi:hypothetical protein NC653_004400 [Populus alba x Populus x berolinensis]|uniref:Uncharacterized protein n=1 Tax=Populus alba x Populus x berolinensis TaxID=444605 RepID=A0AAD6RUQ9_9ROSI|nr:hypothetical protein NC653_004400 [Populus alba x Populus x berolinensis]
MLWKKKNIQDLQLQLQSRKESPSSKQQDFISLSMEIKFLYEDKSPYMFILGRACSDRIEGKLGKRKQYLSNSKSVS